MLVSNAPSNAETQSWREKDQIRAVHHSIAGSKLYAGGFAKVDQSDMDITTYALTLQLCTCTHAQVLARLTKTNVAWKHAWKRSDSLILEDSHMTC